jgi:hypothetical protein
MGSRVESSGERVYGDTMVKRLGGFGYIAVDELNIILKTITT